MQDKKKMLWLLLSRGYTAIKPYVSFIPPTPHVFETCATSAYRLPAGHVHCATSSKQEMYQGADRRNESKWLEKDLEQVVDTERGVCVYVCV